MIDHLWSGRFCGFSRVSGRVWLWLGSPVSMGGYLPGKVGEKRGPIPSWSARGRMREDHVWTGPTLGNAARGIDVANKNKSLKDHEMAGFAWKLPRAKGIKNKQLQDGTKTTKNSPRESVDPPSGDGGSTAILSAPG